MKILQLNITEFGCIKDKIIEPSGDLNIIYGENESGKSTVLLFIKFMLYGLTRRSATNSERERSISWSGHRAAGSMTVSFKGKTYRIERSFNESTRGGSEKYTLLCIDDGSVIESDRSAGEFFLGVPREVFEGSACVGQMRSADINGEKIASSIENMLSAADESVDTSKILKTLDGVRVTYRHKSRSGGSLYEDEQTMNQLRLRIEKARDAILSLDEWEQKLENSKRDFEIAKREFEQKDALLGELNKVTVIKRFARLGQMKNECSELYEKANACKSSLCTGDFMPDRSHTAELKISAKALAEAQKQYEAKREHCLKQDITSFDRGAAKLGEQIEANGGKDAVIASVEAARKTIKAQSALCAVAISVGAILACAGVAVGSLFTAFGFFGLAGIPIALTVAIISAKKRGKAKLIISDICKQHEADENSLAARLDHCVQELEKSREAEKNKALADAELLRAAKNLDERQAALGELISLTQNGAPVTVEAAALEFRRLEALISEREELEGKISAIEQMIRSEEDALCHYDESELRAAVSVDVDEVTPKAIAEAERVRGFLSEKVRVLATRIASLENTVMGLRASAEDPLPLCDRLAELEIKHGADSEFYDALTLAMDSIESAAEAMRTSVTPLISRQAGEILAKLSDGKYSTLRTTSVLGVSVDKDGYAIKSDSLSSGTRDAAYLSLRLALFMRIFKEELPTLVLDESLCQLDGTRAEKMLNLLGRLADEGIQTLLFTSHSREIDICESAGIKYNVIAL